MTKTLPLPRTREVKNSKNDCSVRKITVRSDWFQNLHWTYMYMSCACTNHLIKRLANLHQFALIDYPHQTDNPHLIFTFCDFLGFFLVGGACSALAGLRNTSTRIQIKWVWVYYVYCKGYLFASKWKRLAEVCYMKVLTAILTLLDCLQFLLRQYQQDIRLHSLASQQKSYFPLFIIF